MFGIKVLVKKILKVLGVIPYYKFAKIGCRSYVSNDCIIDNASMVEIGDNVSIGPRAVLYAIYQKIIFGNNIMLGPGVTIVSGDHSIRKVGVPMIDNHEKLPEDDAEIRINDDVWIGANVTILKGCTIGRGCVVAAGAVVTKSLPPYSIGAGCPCRVIKYRFTVEEVLAHERVLYASDQRLSSEQIINSRR